MRLALAEDNITTNMTGRKATATIKAGAHAFNILSKRLYTNPILAVVREYISNALDAGGTSPVEIFAPTVMSPKFMVRDFGKGMDKDFALQQYMTYFESTKSNNDDDIGGFGLGCKSAFAYTDTFTVITRKNGEECSIFIITENGEPTAHEVNVRPTHDVGTTIIVPVNSSDFTAFHNAIRQVLAFVSKDRYALKSLPAPDVIAETFDEYHVLKSNTIFSTSILTIGDIPIAVPREIEAHYPKLLGAKVVPRFKVDEVQPAPSREEVDKSSYQAINKRLESILQTFRANMIAKAKEVPENDNPLTYFKTVLDSLKRINNNLFDDNAIKNIVENNFTWKGKSTANLNLRITNWAGGVEQPLNFEQIYKVLGDVPVYLNKARFEEGITEKLSIFAAGYVFSPPSNNLPAVAGNAVTQAFRKILPVATKNDYNIYLMVRGEKKITRAVRNYIKRTYLDKISRWAPGTFEELLKGNQYLPHYVVDCADEVEAQRIIDALDKNYIFNYKVVEFDDVIDKLAANKASPNYAHRKGIKRKQILKDCTVITIVNAQYDIVRHVEIDFNNLAQYNFTHYAHRTTTESKFYNLTIKHPKLAYGSAYSLPGLISSFFPNFKLLIINKAQEADFRTALVEKAGIEELEKSFTARIDAVVDDPEFALAPVMWAHVRAKLPVATVARRPYVESVLKSLLKNKWPSYMTKNWPIAFGSVKDVAEPKPTQDELDKVLAPVRELMLKCPLIFHLAEDTPMTEILPYVKGNNVNV